MGLASASTPEGARALEYDVVSQILPGLHLAVVRAVAPTRGR
jgi:hypothetical protein